MICKERPTQSLQLCWKQSNQAPVASMMRGDGAPGAGKLTKTSHICRGTLMSTISRRDDRYNSPSLTFRGSCSRTGKHAFALRSKMGRDFAASRTARTILAAPRNFSSLRLLSTPRSTHAEFVTGIWLFTVANY